MAADFQNNLEKKDAGPSIHMMAHFTLRISVGSLNWPVFGAMQTFSFSFICDNLCLDKKASSFFSLEFKSVA